MSRIVRRISCSSRTSCRVIATILLCVVVNATSAQAEDDLSLEKELSAPASKRTEASKSDVGKTDAGKTDAVKPHVQKSDDEAGLGDDLKPTQEGRAKSDEDVDLERFLDDGAASGDKLMEQLNKAIGTMTRARRALADDGSHPKDRTASARDAQSDAVADLDELIRLMEEEMNQPPPEGGGGGGGGGGEQDQSQGGQGEQGASGGAKSKGQKRKSLSGLGGGGQGRSIARGGSRGQTASRQSGGGKPGMGKPSGGKSGESKPGGRSTAGRDAENPTDSAEGVRKNEGAGPAVDPKERLAKDVWGHLPPQLREQLLNVYTEKYLPKYEDLVRAYYEALAEQQRARGSESPTSRSRR